MSTVQRIAKNTSVLLVAQAASYLLAFFYMMYTARYLGAAGFGILSFALAFTGIFAVFGDLGLNTLTVREVAQNKSLTSKYLANVSLMKIILVAITFGLIALIINLMGYPEKTIKVVYLVALSVIFNAFAGMFYSIFQAHKRMEYQAIGQILSAASMLAGVILAIKFGFSIVGFASLYVIASIIVLGYSFAVMKLKFSNPASASVTRVIESDWSFWKQSIKEAWPMGVMAVCTIIRFRIDTVMLSLMKGDVAVGLYNAAYRLLGVSMVVSATFMASMFPVMSQYYKTSMNSFNIAYEKSFKYLLALVLPIALVVTLLARPIINLVFGSEFTGSVQALQILIWAATAMYIGTVTGTAFVAANKQMLAMKLTIVSVALNIILNLIVIPKYSYIGASATTVATEVFGLFLGIFFLSKHGHRFSTANTWSAPLIGISAAGALAVLLTILRVNIFAIASASVILYGVIVYKLGIKQEDKQLIRDTFNLSNIKTSWRR